MDGSRIFDCHGRKAFYIHWSWTVRFGGEYRRENVGISSRKYDEKSCHRKPKGSLAMLNIQGLVGPNILPEQVRWMDTWLIFHDIYVCCLIWRCQTFLDLTYGYGDLELRQPGKVIKLIEHRYRTENRHRWVGGNLPRWTGESSLRNSAKKRA